MFGLWTNKCVQEEECNNNNQRFRRWFGMSIHELRPFIDPLILCNLSECQISESFGRDSGQRIPLIFLSIIYKPAGHVMFDINSSWDWIEIVSSKAATQYWRSQYEYHSQFGAYARVSLCGQEKLENQLEWTIWGIHVFNLRFFNV